MARQLRKPEGCNTAANACLAFGGMCLADNCVHWRPLPGMDQKDGRRVTVAVCDLDEMAQGVKK